MVTKRPEIGYEKMKTVAISLILFLIYHFALPAVIYGYTKLGYDNFGDKVSGLSARSVGMGSTGITTINDASALAVNPATIVNITANKMMISVTPSYALFDEKENLLNTTNENVYFQLSGIGIALPVIRNRLILGVHNSPVLDYSYKNDYESIDAETMTKKDEESKVASGGLRSTDIGFGLKIADELHAGFSYSLLGGSAESKSEKTWFSNGLPNRTSDSDKSYEYDGTGVRYGIVFNQANYNLGAFYQPSATVDNDVTETATNVASGVVSSSKTVSKGEIEYPESFGVGFSYLFKDKFRTLFSADWVRQNWNVLTYVVKYVDGAPTGDKRRHIDGYEEADELKVGLETWLNDWIPVRCGFRYQEFYDTWDNTVYNWYQAANIVKKVVPAFYCFSFGTGYVLERFDVDIGYEFARRSYETTGNARYDEDLQRFTATTRFRW